MCINIRVGVEASVYTDVCARARVNIYSCGYIRV